MIGPYTIIAGLAVWAGTLFVAFGLGQDSEIAMQAREDKATAMATAAAASAAAHAISKLEVQRVEITNRASQIIREVPIYRSDCAHPASMLDEINSARLGTNHSKLPASSAND